MDRSDRDPARARHQHTDRLLNRVPRGTVDGSVTQAWLPFLASTAGREAKTIPAEQVVPGDIVVLESGDVVTADIRLVEAKNLFCDESTLTGESSPVEKSVARLHRTPSSLTGRQCCYKGTAITRGMGAGVVVATGMATELGLTTRLVLEAEPDMSPLERKLAELTRQLVKATLIVTALIAAAGMATGRDFVLMIEAGIALAVAAISEGLPIVATMALARTPRGAWRDGTSWSSAWLRSRRSARPLSSAPTRPAR